MMRDQEVANRVYHGPEAGYNLSWGAVFAGLATFVSVFMLLSLIGTAIGFGTVTPTSDQPLSGVGTGLMIWTVITLLASLFCAGWIAGMTARRAGCVHGFLTWSVSLIVLAYMVTSAVIGTLGVLGSMIGSVAKGVGSVAGTIGETVAGGIADGVSSAADQLKNIDVAGVEGDMKKVLSDTEVRELQPSYLQKEFDGAKEDVTAAAKKIVTNPANAGDVLTQLGDKLQARADKIGKSVDRDAIAKAVAKNTSLTPEEAKKATDNIANGLENASKEASAQIENLKNSVAEAQEKVKKAVEDARVAAEEASRKVAMASVILFIGLAIGMALTSYAGLLGSKMAKRHACVER